LSEPDIPVVAKKKSHGNGSGSDHVFFVEAKYDFPDPKVINGMLLDHRWRRVHPVPSPIGVPVHLFDELAKSQGFLNYEAAMALAMWFLAAPEWACCIRVRLVKVKFEWSYNAEELGVGESMNSTDMMRAAKFSDRPPIMGDQ